MFSKVLLQMENEFLQLVCPYWLKEENWGGYLVVSRTFYLICSWYTTQRTEYNGVHFFPRDYPEQHISVHLNIKVHTKELHLVTLEETYEIPCPGVFQSGLSHSLINAANSKWV